MCRLIGRTQVTSPQQEETMLNVVALEIASIGGGGGKLAGGGGGKVSGGGGGKRHGGGGGKF
jgi:hypothetical protein